ncbi:MAG: hypothetical protein ACPGR6_02730 [Candidatus Puniceispirillaceae bacterium]
MVLSALRGLGRHARLALPVGILIALILPDMALRWDIILPINITFIYAASMIRLDLKATALLAFTFKRLALTLSITLFILCLIPVLYVMLAQISGLATLYYPSLIWFAVAPPIASTVWICTLLGFRAALAMEVVVLTSLAAPFTGPFMAGWLLSDIAAIDQLALFFKLAGMICGGTLIAYLGQSYLGRKKIEDNRHVFDGLSALAMLVFLIPVFNGVAVVIIQQPQLAFYLCALAFAMNMGPQILLLGLGYIFARQAAPLQVLAIVTGNRNVGLYFAALPPEPVFALFTAMYQVPLYLTPLIIGRISRLLQPDLPAR